MADKAWRKSANENVVASKPLNSADAANSASHTEWVWPNRLIRSITCARGFDKPLWGKNISRS
jgi:hypothetical protein